MGGQVLTATSVGYRVAHLTRDGPVAARVRATFEHACHLLTDGGELLTLLEGDRRGPMTVIVPGLAAALGMVDEGHSATLTAGALTLEPATLRVDLHAAAVWTRPAPPGRPPADRDARHARVRVARAMALRHEAPGFVRLLDGGAAGEEGEGRPAGAGWLATMTEQRGRSAIGELAAALRAGDVGGAGAAAAALIGLGPGLTPAAAHSSSFRTWSALMRGGEVIQSRISCAIWASSPLSDVSSSQRAKMPRPPMDSMVMNSPFPYP